MAPEAPISTPITKRGSVIGRLPSAGVGAAKGAPSPRKGGFQRLRGIRGLEHTPLEAVGSPLEYRW